MEYILVLIDSATRQNLRTVREYSCTYLAHDLRVLAADCPQKTGNVRVLGDTILEFDNVTVGAGSTRELGDGESGGGTECWYDKCSNDDRSKGLHD